MWWLQVNMSLWMDNCRRLYCRRAKLINHCILWWSWLSTAWLEEVDIWVVPEPPRSAGYDPRPWWHVTYKVACWYGINGYVQHCLVNAANTLWHHHSKGPRHGIGWWNASSVSRQLSPISTYIILIETGANHLLSKLSELLCKDLAIIPPHLCVTFKIGDILRACDKESNFTANYTKGYGSMFHAWMETFCPGSLFIPVMWVLNGN